MVYALFWVDTLSSRQLIMTAKRANPDIRINIGCQEVPTAQERKPIHRIAPEIIALLVYFWKNLL